MISIYAQMGRDETFCVSAHGHAKAARNEEDHDLVCCAVSTILCMLANSCALIGDVNTVYHASSGNALVTVTGIPDDLWAEINARFQMAVDGLTGLSIQYPQNLQVKVEN